MAGMTICLSFEVYSKTGAKLQANYTNREETERGENWLLS